MNELYGEYPVTKSGQRVGTLSVFPNGLFTEFHCRCSYASTEVLRLFCVSDGRHIGIGVLAPDSGELALSKKLSRSSLQTLGFSGAVTECYVSSSSSGDKKADVPLKPMPTESSSTSNGASAAEAPATDGDDAGKYAPETPVSAGSVKAVQSTEKAPQAAPPSVTLPLKAQQPAPWESKLADPFPQENVISKPSRCEYANPGPLPKAMPASDMTSSPKISGGLGTQEAPPAWNVEHDPARLFYSPELSSACHSVNGALTRREGGITLLAVPVSSDEPFPMLPVFCFGEPWIIGGRDYIVFKVKNGELYADE